MKEVVALVNQLFLETDAVSQKVERQAIGVFKVEINCALSFSGVLKSGRGCVRSGRSRRRRLRARNLLSVRLLRANRHKATRHHRQVRSEHAELHQGEKIALVTASSLCEF